MPEERRERVVGPQAEGPHSFVGAQSKSFTAPDETRTFEKGRIDLVRVDGHVVGRLTLEPGWRWTQHVRPLVGTAWCWATHTQFHLVGRIRYRLVDGSEFEAGPGQVSVLPCGHDSWVVGEEIAVVIDWTGAAAYARRWVP